MPQPTATARKRSRCGTSSVMRMSVEEDHLMHTSAFVRNVESDAVEGAGETAVMEIDAGHPAVVLTEADGIGAPHQFRDAVPQPRFDDLEGASVSEGSVKNQQKASTKKTASGVLPQRSPNAATWTRTCRPRPSPSLPRRRLSVVPHKASVAILQGTSHAQPCRRRSSTRPPTALTSGDFSDAPSPSGETRQALGGLERGHVLEVRFDDPEAWKICRRCLRAMVTRCFL